MASTGLDIRNNILYGMGTCTDTEIVVPESVTQVYRNAFSGQSRQFSIEFLGTMSYMYPYAFNSCGVTSVKLNNTSSLEIGEYCFQNCKNLTTVDGSSKVVKLASYVFLNSGLKSFDLNLSYNISPSFGPFFNCRNLKDVTVSAQTITIAPYTFAHCSSIEQIIIPEGVRVISQGAFLDCTNLSSITIPSTVEFIGKEAFRNCNNLEYVNMAPIKSGLTRTIRSRALMGTRLCSHSNV